MDKEKRVESETVQYAVSGNIDLLLELYDKETDPVLKAKIEKYINDHVYQIAVTAEVLPRANILNVNRLRELRDLKYFYNAIRNFNFVNVQNLFAQAKGMEIGLDYLQELLTLINYDSLDIQTVSHLAIYFSVLVLHKKLLEQNYIWQGQLENIQSVAANPASYSVNKRTSDERLPRAKLVAKMEEEFTSTIADYALDLSEADYTTFMKNLNSVDKALAKEVKEMVEEERKILEKKKKEKAKKKEKEKKTARSESEEEEEEEDLDMEREENED